MQMMWPNQQWPLWQLCNKSVVGEGNGLFPSLVLTQVSFLLACTLPTVQAQVVLAWDLLACTHPHLVSPAHLPHMATSCLGPTVRLGWPACEVP
jgi:hypothetical protein